MKVRKILSISQYLRNKNSLIGNQFILEIDFSYTNNKSSIDLKARKMFIEAKEEIENVSCIRFVERTNEKDFVKIITGNHG